jgi:protocatechuate 3,4-dioxygenase beta subunit
MRREVTRRYVVAAGVIGAAAALPGAAWAELVATPRQSTGPFYPVRLPLDSDNDLVTVAGRPEPAAGQVTHVFGRVLDPDGRPVADAEVEIWQCDAAGFYHHPGDRGGQADPNFQGFGRTAADAEGAYRFRTIRPVPYTGRTPHIHFAVKGAGFETLITQMYVAGEPLNERDGLFNRIRDPEQRASVLVTLAPAPEVEAGALAGRFDLVIARNLFRS